jgi:hypothetical protein
MSNRSWVADALLGSPTPPPRWLDPRNAGTGWTAPWAGYWSQHMHVPAGYIQEELRALWTCVNPPIVQGWAWCLALAGVVVTLLGLDRLSHSSVMDGPTLLMVLAPIPVWFAAILAGGFFSHDVELREGEVCVRRWTDVWFGGKGRVVGPVATISTGRSAAFKQHHDRLAVHLPRERHLLGGDVELAVRAAPQRADPARRLASRWIAAARAGSLPSLGPSASSSAGRTGLSSPGLRLPVSPHSEP